MRHGQRAQIVLLVDTFLPEGAPRAQASPALLIAENPPPSIVVYGSLEEPYAEQSSSFVEALQAKGGSARLVVLDTHHDGTALALTDPDNLLTKAIVQLIATAY